MIGKTVQVSSRSFKYYTGGRGITESNLFISDVNVVYPTYEGQFQNL